MPRWMIARAAVLLVVVIAAFEGCADASCDDLLAALHKKPDNLEFQGCKQRIDLQGEPRQASYRVAGGHAADVENYLAEQVQLKKLQRTCCVWESAENSYSDSGGRRLIIAMSTQETTVDKRDQWTKIPYFYVTVNEYRDDP